MLLDEIYYEKKNVSVILPINVLALGIILANRFVRTVFIESAQMIHRYVLVKSIARAPYCFIFCVSSCDIVRPLFLTV